MSCGGILGKIVGYLWIFSIWLTTFILLIAKLSGEVNYSWFWVVFPLLLHYGILFIILLIKHIIFIKGIWNNEKQSTAAVL